MTQPLLIFDFETGGLDPTKHAAASVAAQLVEPATLAQIGTYQAVIQPYGQYQYDPKAMVVNGLTQADLEAGQEVEEVVANLVSLLQLGNPSGLERNRPVLGGHNPLFDIGFLQQIFAHCQLDLAQYVDGKLDFYRHFLPTVVDTCLLSKLRFATSKHKVVHKLTACCDREGIQLSQAHEASADVAGTISLLGCYVTALRGQAGQPDAANELLPRRQRLTLQI